MQKNRGAQVVSGDEGIVVVGQPSSSTSGFRGGVGGRPGDGGDEEDDGDGGLALAIGGGIASSIESGVGGCGGEDEIGEAGEFENE